jgi:hypothetical protein
MTGDVETLLDVMLEARRLVALPGNDFSWSSWVDAEHALTEIDPHIARLRDGGGSAGAMAILFLPTGPLQELSLSSGWGDAFVALADRFEIAACAHTGAATYHCAVCGRQAGRLVVEGEELRRESFTSTLTQPVTPAVRAALGSAERLHALDPELAPFYCPDCRASYCGEHWRRRDIFEGAFHDSIRGICPKGHDQMLEN